MITAVMHAPADASAPFGLKSDIALSPKSADTVAKVKIRTTPKISRKSILDLSAAATLYRADTKVRGGFANLCLSASRLNEGSKCASFLLRLPLSLSSQAAKPVGTIPLSSKVTTICVQRPGLSVS